MSKFAPGQVWAYETRPGEDDSRVIVLRVDATQHAGVIVHVAVEGVSIFNPSNPDQPTRAIGFMPIAEGSLEKSVTRLVVTESPFVPPADFDEGYAGWKTAFDEGKAGIWTATVARVVQAVDDGIRQTR
jgi:hypothetical protein